MAYRALVTVYVIRIVHYKFCHLVIYIIYSVDFYMRGALIAQFCDMIFVITIMKVAGNTV